MNRYICRDLSGVLTIKSSHELSILLDCMNDCCRVKNNERSKKFRNILENKSIFFKFLSATYVLRQTEGFGFGSQSNYDYYQQLKRFIQRHSTILTYTLKNEYLILVKIEHPIFCFLPIWYFIQ